MVDATVPVVVTADAACTPMGPADALVFPVLMSKILTVVSLLPLKHSRLQPTGQKEQTLRVNSKIKMPKDLHFRRPHGDSGLKERGSTV